MFLQFASQTKKEIQISCVLSRPPPAHKYRYLDTIHRVRSVTLCAKAKGSTYTKFIDFVNVKHSA